MWVDRDFGDRWLGEWLAARGVMSFVYTQHAAARLSGAYNGFWLRCCLVGVGAMAETQRDQRVLSCIVHRASPASGLVEGLVMVAAFRLGTPPAFGSSSLVFCLS